MYKRIKKLSDYLNQENDNPSLYINKELLKKFDIFKKWLIKNGAIFSKNIDFPYVYGPFNLIGCKSISKIKENESILLIPKKIMIISKELKYLDEYLEDIIDELYKIVDIPTIYLTLNLYLENKKKKSFYRPYLDLIFSNYNFLNDFTEKNMKYFDGDIKMIKSIKQKINKINLLYNLIKQNKYFKEITREEFFFCYSQVISREFYLDDTSTALIPLADSLNHKNIDIHYEIYDSENYVFKNSNNFTLDADCNIDLSPTFIKQYPVITNTKKKQIKCFNFSKKRNKKEIKKKNTKIINIEDTDYFSISTSKGEIIEKGNQVFTNYFNGGNKYFLKNYGFCLIDNIYDYTTLILEIENDILLHKYLEILFKKKLKNKPNSITKYLKIKIFFNEICFYLIKYFRFLYFYKVKKDINQYINYIFDIILEIELISLSLDCLRTKLSILNKNNNSIENEIEVLENEIYNNNKKNSFKANVYIYKITQKINIMNQIEVLECILLVMKKHKKKIKSYIDLLDYEKDFVNISQFDTDKNSKMKIINFIKNTLIIVD